MAIFRAIFGALIKAARSPRNPLHPIFSPANATPGPGPNPILNSFTINGDPSTATVTAGTAVNLAWNVSQSTEVQVTAGNNTDYGWYPQAPVSTATPNSQGSRNYFLRARNGGSAWTVFEPVHSNVTVTMSAPNLSSIYAADSCDRASSNTTPNPPSDGGASWQALGTSVWGISTSTNGFRKTGIFCVSNQTGDLCVRDVLHPNVYHSMRITGDFPSNVSLAFRVTDTNNYWYLSCTTSGVTLRKVVAGVDSLAGTLTGIDGIVPWTVPNVQYLGDVAAIDCNGSTIKCYFNGTLGLTVTDSFNSTATKHGVRNIQGGGFLCNMIITGASGCMLDQSLLVPDFCFTPTTQSIKTGSWFDPTVWSGGVVPGTNDVAWVTNGTVVTVDGFTNTTTNGIGVRPGGQLLFATNMKVRLPACHVVVYDTDGVNPQGYLEIGNAANPVNPNQIQDQTAALVLVKAPYSALDANHWGAGLYIVGKFRTCGSAKTMFARCATAPTAGSTSITFTTPVSGWVQGDRLFLPDSHGLAGSELWTATTQPTPHYEALVLESVSADGKTITFISSTSNTTALAFDHPGSTEPVNNAVEYTPHVCNLSMWASVRTSDPTDIDRPHVLITNRANYDSRYTTYHSTGRAVPFPGRALQFRRMWGPVGGLGYDATTDPLEMKPGDPSNTLGLNGPSFRLYGCTVFDPLPIPGLQVASAQWGIVHDEAHFGLVSNCNSVNWGGAGIMAHNGGERSNIWEFNFVSLIRGNGARTNFDGGTSTVPSSTVQRTSNVATVVTQIAHGFLTGDIVTVISAPGDGSLNGNYVITVVNNTTFTYANNGPDAGPFTNTVVMFGPAHGTFGHPDAQGQGVGFWPRNHDQIIRFNVASDCRGMVGGNGVPGGEFTYGFSCNPLSSGSTAPLGSFSRTPTAQGANPYSNTPTDRQTFVPNGAGSVLRGNHDNEAYGGYSGYTFWYAENSGTTVPQSTFAAVPFGTLSNIVIWNISNLGVFIYPTTVATLDNWVIRSGPTALVGLWSSDYHSYNLTISNCDIRGFGANSFAADVFEGGWGFLNYINCTFANAGPSITIRDRTYGGGASEGNFLGYEMLNQYDQWKWNRIITINNCKYLTFAGSGKSINLTTGDSGGGPNGTGSQAPASPQSVVVINHNQVPGDNFNVYDARSIASATPLQQTIKGGLSFPGGITTPFYIGAPIGAAFNPSDPTSTPVNQPTQTNQLSHDNWNVDGSPKSRPMVQYLRRGQRVVAPNPDTPGICMNGKIVPTGYTTRADINGFVHSK